MLNKTIDKSKKAKPQGWRFKGSHDELHSKYYKRPENVLSARAFENAKHNGRIVYEPRLGKADMRQDKRFEKGGILSSLWSILTQKVSVNDIIGK